MYLNTIDKMIGSLKSLTELFRQIFLFFCIELIFIYLVCSNRFGRMLIHMIKGKIEKKVCPVVGNIRSLLSA